MITVSQLTRRFDGRLAVENLSFEIRRGEIFALLGPNGAGKTTTMRLLAGLIAPSSGTIAIDGVRLDAGSAGRLRARIGLLTEQPGFWDRLSLEENLSVYAGLYQVARSGSVVRETLERFGLWDRRRDPAGTLSKGMKQKLALGRALLHDPAIVLLDEPTAGLDPEIARSVRHLIVELREGGRAVLLSTHNLDEAERLADRVAVLRSRLLALDTPSALRRQLFASRVRIHLAEPPEAFLDVARRAGVSGASALNGSLVLDVEAPERVVPEIVRALVGAGASIREVVIEQPSLEDIYLTVTRS